MAVSKPVRPSMLIRGTVLGIEDKQEYVDNKPSGRVGRRDVKLLLENYATADVRFPNRPESPRVPAVGEVVGLMVELGESREWGSSLTVTGYVTGDELEAFHALILQPVGK
jgi:hypothetical protein